jgi:hypothetical protein
MATRYSLEDINTIIFQGFNYVLPAATLSIISELAQQVGSPDYVRTPVFQKRENPMKAESSTTSSKEFLKKKRGNKSMEVVDDADWETLRSFQATKIEEKVGIEAKMDTIRVYLNKLSDKNYIDMRNKIVEVIDQLFSEKINTEDLARLGNFIFENASANRFHSKMYADLFSDLITRYEIMNAIFEENLEKFTTLFNSIEYVEASENYDKFCEINKVNEKRKSLATFYVNLMNNGIIKSSKIKNITRTLLSQIFEFITLDNKKNHVDELTENVFILYKKELYENDEADDYELINDLTIMEVIEKIAHSKVKDYKSLTNKALFKFMDMIEM